MARAAVVLALVVCCLLVATAPAHRPVDHPPARVADSVVLVDRKPLPQPVRALADCGGVSIRGPAHSSEDVILIHTVSNI